MKITTVGVDLAKTVFQIHGVDDRGRAVLRKQLKRTEMLSFFANLAPCLIGMEACASAHHWARKLIELGHQVKLMAPQFVKPYVKSNKNDRNARSSRPAAGCQSVSVSSCVCRYPPRAAAQIPYALFFRFVDDAVFVMACFYSSRDPRIWQQRD